MHTQTYIHEFALKKEEMVELQSVMDAQMDTKKTRNWCCYQKRRFQKEGQQQKIESLWKCKSISTLKKNV